MMIDSAISIHKEVKNVGGGLPPIAKYQSQCLCLTHCYREQAPSHIGFVMLMGAFI